jgi:hypothetical protein
MNCNVRDRRSARSVDSVPTASLHPCSNDKLSLNGGSGQTKVTIGFEPPSGQIINCILDRQRVPEGCPAEEHCPQPGTIAINLIAEHDIVDRTSPAP